MPYYESADFEATRGFYTRMLGLEEGTLRRRLHRLRLRPGAGPLCAAGRRAGAAQDGRASLGAVDAAHAEAVRAGHEVIYGPVDEPWGVRRFFVRDPQGVVISVLAHR
jgi:catechol 2,3-dioxygenase-like lactoylglutathione lyase family enzyme